MRVLLFSHLLVYATSQLPSQDILALLEFKKGIKHDPTGYVLSSWNEESIDFNGCPSSWNGIMCNGANVAGVILDDLALSVDAAHLSVLSNLTMLVKLSMSNNSISGPLPSNIGDLKSLEYLDLSDNQISSSLPMQIGKLGNLKNLSLAENNFSGSILESSVSGLSSIQSLDLSANSFSGPMPTSLRKLMNVVSLNLSRNGFTKSIPKGFELLESLKVLDLHDNMLDGDLDSQLIFLTSAVYVDFSGNSLVNSALPQHKFLHGISDTVRYLNLSHNQLTGSIVSGGEAQILASLKVLDLSYNQLSGELPEFGFVYDLEVLRLCNNKFSGLIPNNLLKGDSLVLTELDLSGNNLSGPISMITSTTLHTLNLSSNGLSGDLPLLTGSVAVLDLSNNQFNGNLTWLAKWANVEILDLSQNRLTGPIPEETSQFLRLNYLNLSHNALDNTLPKVLSRFPKLAVLDLSFNQFDGPLLSPLVASTTLQELHLQNNLLVGNITFDSPQTSLFGTNLRMLDLSHNLFEGSFPNEIGSLIKLEMLNLGGNKLSGSLPASSMEKLSSLNSLDLSQNHFTGDLPNNLSNNLVSFNASYNDLSGVVPENLRDFPTSSFYPGNSRLKLPQGSQEHGPGTGGSRKNRSRKIIRVVVIVVCVLALVIFLILLAICCLYCICASKTRPTLQKDSRRTSGPPSNPLVVSAEDIATSTKKGSSSKEIITSADEKLAGLSPSSKKSQLSWSPESRESYYTTTAAEENISRLDIRSSPDRLVGELHFLDDFLISLTPEELSRAPAEVLGRSSHGTSYRATLDNGLFLTVKWLREGVAKQRKDFAKEAKKFANIRHPNVVGLRGYYWGPTQHEKLILSDYISPGSLASFLYDRPGRRPGPPLSWAQRLKIAVDVARGLNYLHFDRAVPHGNLKASNILLDGPDLNARVADYCLHRLMTQTGTIQQILDAGVLGYRAPELASSRKPLPSFKSDVYSFGVILLELLTGKCAGDVVSSNQDGGGVELTDWVRLRAAEGCGPQCFDASLVIELADPQTEKGMKEVLGLALRCIRSVSERPGIKTVYEDLSSI